MDLRAGYFRWLEERAFAGTHKRPSRFRYLMAFLETQEYAYLIPMDGNRYDDGIELRYRYGYENGIPAAEIASGIDISPCCMLEMMLALAMRCEDIMWEPTFGDGTSHWFWQMVQNLGLLIEDEDWDEYEAEDRLERFLSHEYDPNGQGGLFPLRNPRRDLRNVEIWYQAMWYLNEQTQN